MQRKELHTTRHPLPHWPGLLVVDAAVNVTGHRVTVVQRQRYVLQCCSLGVQNEG